LRSILIWGIEYSELLGRVSVNVACRISGQPQPQPNYY
jgi:hypothetical protein